MPVGDIITDLLKVGTDLAKQKIQSLTSTKTVTNAVKNLVNKKMSKGTDPATAKEESINEVALTTATQITEIAKAERQIPTWLVISGGVAVIVIGGVVFLITRRR